MLRQPVRGSFLTVYRKGLVAYPPQLKYAPFGHRATSITLDFISGPSKQVGYSETFALRSANAKLEELELLCLIRNT